MAGLPGGEGVWGRGFAGTGIRLYCHKGPLASWQTVPQAQDDRAFQDRQGGGEYGT